MADLLIRDVTLRDGLQDEAPVPKRVKLDLYEALLAAGVRDLELTSFVRADRVPAMADAEALVRATAGSPATRWGLVLNERGAQRALAAGLGHLQMVVSVSDTHSRHNAGRSTEEALAAVCAIVALAARHDAVVELTLATAFGCPYEQQVAPSKVVSLAAAATAAGVAAIGLADTIGVAVPPEVARVVRSVVAETGLPVGAHLHDTRGLGLANALAALDAGATRLDAGVGGLGGCPFAPGASGNLPTEDLVHALDAMGVDTGISVDGLLAAARLACTAAGRPVTSHIGIAGPRFATPRPESAD